MILITVSRLSSAILRPSKNVLAFARLAQQENRAPLHHVDAVVDEGADGFGEAQLPRLAVEHGQEDHGEAFLHCVCL